MIRMMWYDSDNESIVHKLFIWNAQEVKTDTSRSNVKSGLIKCERYSLLNKKFEQKIRKEVIFKKTVLKVKIR